VTGAPPREVESPTPVTAGRGGSARGGHGGTHCGVISGGAGEHHSGAGRRDRGAPQTLEEEEAGLLQPEVSGISPVRP
jgi:hypothetical protein